MFAPIVAHLITIQNLIEMEIRFSGIGVPAQWGLAPKAGMTKVNNWEAICVTDVDGSLCDGVYYFDSGQRARKWNMQDGHAFQLLKENNILPIMMSGESDENIFKRAEKLEVVFLPSKNKVETLFQFIETMGLPADLPLIVFGNDLNDLPLMEIADFVGCPSNSFLDVRVYVQDRQHNNRTGFYCENKGGDGAFREFVEKLTSRLFCA